MSRTQPTHVVHVLPFSEQLVLLLRRGLPRQCCNQYTCHTFTTNMSHLCHTLSLSCCHTACEPHLMMSSSPLSASADCSRSLGWWGITSGQLEGLPALPNSARTTLQRQQQQQQKAQRCARYMGENKRLDLMLASMLLYTLQWRTCSVVRPGLS